MAWFNAGLSSNSGGASSFNELDDVSINTQTLSNGQVPVYNSSTQKWENGEQSGGSSGHTIINDGGTSLTQRDNLQFKGAYSEDNSANEKTVVNVVREMTKAQFDQLTNNEKIGFINITDITGGNDDRFQPVIYSTEEREIGVWIDGKPLYQKSYADMLAGVETSKVIDANIKTDSGIYEVKSIDGIWAIGSLSYATTTLQNFGVMGSYSAGSETAYVKITSNGLTVSKTGSNYGIQCIVTIYYTKTTDTPGSGQWTPQGVPAHHYSTDEQVVGTWIDGSTIYEKTVDCGVLPNNDSKQVAHGITNIDKIVNFVGIAYAISSGTALQLAYPSSINNFSIDMSVNKTNINILTLTDRTSFNGYVTIRYTKSST